MKFMNEFLHLKLAIKFIFFHAITNQSHAVEGEICRVEFIHKLLSSESSAAKKENKKKDSPVNFLSYKK